MKNKICNTWYWLFCGDRLISRRAWTWLLINTREVWRAK